MRGQSRKMGERAGELRGFWGWNEVEDMVKAEVGVDVDVNVNSEGRGERI